MIELERPQLTTRTRWMARRDMPEVLAIEDASSDYPWCEEEFLRVLRQRNCIGMVAEHGDRIAGFMVYDFYKTRINLLNIAVAPDCRRRGVGSQMIRELKSKLTTERRSGLTAMIRETNLPMANFLKRHNFEAILARNHFDPEDGYQFGFLIEQVPEIVQKYREIFNG